MKIGNNSGWDKVRPQYQELLEQLKREVTARFGSELCAYYLLGSVGRGQDVPGVSDVDTEIFIRRDTTEDDKSWAKQLRERYEPKYPDLVGIDLGVKNISGFHAEDAEPLRFIVATDGLLLAGLDLNEDNLWEGYSYPDLARMLNKNYREALDMIRGDILNPDEEDQNNPDSVSECVKWIAKKILRLGLGMAMTQGNIYTRRIQDMAGIFSESFPDYAAPMELALGQYLSPTNDAKEAMGFLDHMDQTIYSLADRTLL